MAYFGENPKQAQPNSVFPVLQRFVTGFRVSGWGAGGQGGRGRSVFPVIIQVIYIQVATTPQVQANSAQTSHIDVWERDFNH